MHSAVEQKLKRGREVEDEAELSGATLSLNGDRIVDDESAIATCPSSTFSSQIILVCNNGSGQTHSHPGPSKATFVFR